MSKTTLIMYQTEGNKIRAPKVKPNVFSHQSPDMAASLTRNLAHLHEILGEVKGLTAKILKTNVIRECPNSLSNIQHDPTTNDVKKKKKKETEENLRQQMAKQCPIKVQKSESKGCRKPSQKLFIDNIAAEDTTDKELKSLLNNDSPTLTIDSDSKIQSTDQGPYFVVTFFNQREKNFLAKATVKYFFSKFGPVSEIKYTENGLVFISYKEKEGALKAHETMNMGTKYRAWITNNQMLLNDDDVELRSTLGSYSQKQTGPKNKPMRTKKIMEDEKVASNVDDRPKPPINNLEALPPTTNMISNIQKTDDNPRELSLVFPRFENAVYFEKAPISSQPLKIEHIIPNIFDSHCHLDRMFYQLIGKNFYLDNLPSKYKINGLVCKNPFDFMKHEFKSKFSLEGFINVITNPTYFDKKYWEWIVANEPNVYLALGCHPSDASTYDEIADWQLEKGKLKA